MAVVWKLGRVATGETKTLEEWQIKGAVRTLVNQGRDTLALNFGGSDLLGNSPFNSAESLRLDRVVDGVATTVFLGRIINEVRGAYGSTEGFSVNVAGPWWYLENTVYMQNEYFVTSGAANPAPTAPATTLVITDFVRERKTTSAILLKEDQEGATVDSRAQIIDALEYAIAKGAPIALGTIDDGIGIPREAIQDATCAEIILKSLRWTPDQSIYFDYSVDPPTINIRTPANRTALALDIADATIAEVEINPRDDLTLAGVTINYLRRHQRENFEFVTLDKDQAGDAPEGIGALILTLELFGSYLVASPDLSGAPPFLVEAEAIPAGLAASLYDAYSAVPYEGRIQLVQEECAALPWTNRKLSIANGVPAWAAAAMIVQQASDDIFAGRTELTVGPPRQLGAQDLLGLVRKGRTQAPALKDVFGGGGSPHTPTVPPSTQDPRAIFGPEGAPELILYAWREQNAGFPNSYGVYGYDEAIVNQTEGGPGHSILASALSVGSVVNHFGARIGRGQDKYISASAGGVIRIRNDSVLTPIPPWLLPGPSYRVLAYTTPVTIT